MRCRAIELTVYDRAIMASESSNINCRVAPPVTSRASILRVWDIVNTHFGSLLTTAERLATKSRAEINIQSQVKELRDLMCACNRRLKTVQAYISELQKEEETGALNNCQSQLTPYSDLAGEWHFLYLVDNRVFGYMQLVPESVSVVRESGHEEGSTAVKRAEFAIPVGVLREANETLDHDESRPDSRCDRLLCPCCQMSFTNSVFWKHALFEIAERGNRVPALQSLDRTETPRWIVEESAGWRNPIYRPRGLESTCEIGQALAELNLKHFLSDYDFSRALDNTFEFLALQLRT